MNFRPVAHGINDPLDALIQLVLPVVIVGGLWWWSARAERRKHQTKDRR